MLVYRALGIHPSANETLTWLDPAYKEDNVENLQTHYSAVLPEDETSTSRSRPRSFPFHFPFPLPTSRGEEGRQATINQ